MTEKRTVVDDNQRDSIIHVLCEKCRSKVAHRVAHNIKVSGEEVDEEHGPLYDWFDNYQIIECRGCSTTSFRIEKYFSEDYDPGDDNQALKETLFPHRTVEDIANKSNDFLPKSLRQIYNETVDSINRGSCLLAAAGMRTLVEGICNDKKIKNGPVDLDNPKSKRFDKLGPRVNGLVEKGLIPKVYAQALRVHRFVGDDALHFLSAPEIENIKLAFEAVEHVLTSIYHFPMNASVLAKRMGKRKKRAPRV